MGTGNSGMTYRTAKPSHLPAQISNSFGLRRTGRVPDFPYIVEESSQCPHYDAFSFLAAYAEFNVSEKTRQTRCEQLIDWLRFKESERARNVGVDRQLLLYRLHLEECISGRTGRPLARSTQLGRLDLAAHYERWLCAQEPRPEPFSLPISRGPRRRSQPRQKVDPFSQAEMLQVLHDLRGAGSSQREGAATRNSLIATVGFVTGARLDEILSIEYSQVIIWEHGVEGTTLVLKRSKGRQSQFTGRTIFIPSHLKNMLIDYALNERKNVVDYAKKQSKSYKEPLNLFVNGKGAKSKSVGKPYKQRRANEMFANAQISCGITKDVLKFNVVSGISERKTVAKHTFHHTRHTYVVMAYRYYRSAGLSSDQIWRALADNLGHRQVSTTIEIYGASITDEEVRLRDGQFAVMESLIQGRY